MNIINDNFNKDDYDTLYKEIICHIQQTKTSIETIKERGILDNYWKLGEILIEIGDDSERTLKDFRDTINNQIGNNPILGYHTTNTHWLKLAKVWVREHRQHDKKIMLSGSVTWVQWALLLDIVNSAPQRYWLACQTIKQGWDAITLLRAARSLPSSYLNHG